MAGDREAYTPTTDDMRRHIVSMGHLAGRNGEVDGATFDRWLAAYTREVREETKAGIAGAQEAAFSGDEYEENAAAAAGEGEWSWFKWLATSTTREWAGDLDAKSPARPSDISDVQEPEA